MPSPRHRWWRHLRAAPPGTRFESYYHTRAAARLRGESRWSRPLRLVGAALAVLIAVPLMMLPGPAVLFWSIAALLLAGESRHLARQLDRAELALRRLWSRLSRRR
jgi:hypothetical protein